MNDSSIYVGREQVILRAFLNWLSDQIESFDLTVEAREGLIDMFIREVYQTLINLADK